MDLNYEKFFAQYVAAYNEALSGSPNLKYIRSFFTDQFLAAGPDSVETGKNGLVFSMVLKKAYSFYKKIGTRGLRMRKLEVTPIDEYHDMVKVFYSAEYVKKSSQKMSIEFEVTYFLQRQGPKIFAFVSGDEMKAYQDAGLI